jgi:sialate O-acetylesterase
MRNLFILSGILLTVNVNAELKMSKIFSDNMVLQRGIALPVWGWTSPGEKVTVNFKEQQKSSVADGEGKWMLKLDPLAVSSKPDKLTVTATTGKKEFNNILVGDVWLCSGQSNMGISFRKYPDEAVGIKDTQLRHISRRLDSGWRICDTKSLQNFSRVAYYFGAELRKDLQIPIGLINVSLGCSSIEAWMTPESFAANDFLKDELVEMKKFQQFHSNYKQCSAEEKERVFLEHCQSKYTVARNFLKNGKPNADKYRRILWHMTAVKPAFLYNSLVVPVIPFGIKGMIWYQGETNVNDEQYAQKQQILIESWRKLWNQGQFPCYIVQIAPFKGYPGLPDFWLEQYEAVRRIKNTGLVSTVDIGDINECHPRNKHDVGLRLALLALRDTYGKRNIVASGPTYKSAKIVGNRIIVSFANLGNGLTTGDGKAPDWFEVAGADGKFFKAQAKIIQDNVEVSSPQVKKAKYVRCAWKHIAQPNLRNKDGLPVFPFNNILPFFSKKTD